MFKRRRFPVAIILVCVRWYCKYGISYRDLAEMMQERCVEVDPFTIMRWIHRDAPEFEKRVRAYQGYGSTSWLMCSPGLRGGVRDISPGSMPFCVERCWPLQSKGNVSAGRVSAKHCQAPPDVGLLALVWNIKCEVIPGLHASVTDDCTQSSSRRDR